MIEPKTPLVGRSAGIEIKHVGRSGLAGAIAKLDPPKTGDKDVRAATLQEACEGAGLAVVGAHPSAAQKCRSKHQRSFHARASRTCSI